MRYRKSSVIAFLLAVAFEPLLAEDFLTAGTNPVVEEEEVTRVRSALFEMGNASTLSGNYLPTGLYTNLQGILAPTGKNQTYNRGYYNFTQTNEMWKLEAGADLYLYYNTSEDYYKFLHLQQLYVKGNWGKYTIQLGSKEEKGEFVPELSSGNMLWSGNTRPAPTLRIGTDDFVSTFFTNHLFQLKANIWWSKHTDGALSRANYERYEAIYAKEGHVSHYYDNITDNRQHAKVESPWFHRKSIFIRTTNEKPLFVTFGIEHAVMYGGTVNGQDCSGSANWLRALMGGSGKKQGNEFNHALTQDYRLDYRHDKIHIGLYKQHYADDMKGGLFSNGADGLWGAQITLPKSRWFRNIVVEYLHTTNQGGTVYANDVYNKLGESKVHRTAGNSNFYHDQHMGAWTHYGMILGNPLLASPLYNSDYYPDMASNMLRAYHLAFSGQLMYCLDYKVRVQHTDSWGTPFAPFGEIRSCTSLLVDVAYPINEQWRVRGGVSIDNGTLYGNNSGIHLNIQYSL